jgi:hypothetical protein
MQNLLQQCKSSIVPRPSKRKPLSMATFRGVSNTTSLVPETLQLTAAFAPENPPWNVSSFESETVHHQLVVASIRNVSYMPVPRVNLTLAGETAIATAVRAAKVDQVLLNIGRQSSFLQEIYGSNYVARTVASLGSAYLEQTLDQALYASNVGISPILVTPSDSYLFTFSSKPPILSTCFWSLTLYLPNHHFFANPLEWYSLGDRSNLTYPDGSLVYGGPKSSTTDESFQILVQSTATPPPANWTSKYVPPPQVYVPGEPADHHVAGFLLFRARLMYRL